MCSLSVGGSRAVCIHQQGVAQCTHWLSISVQQTSDHKESPFSVILPRSLVLHFAIEPTCNIWVGGRLLDSPCVLEKKGENLKKWDREETWIYKTDPQEVEDLGRVLEIIQIDPWRRAARDGADSKSALDSFNFRSMSLT